MALGAVAALGACLSFSLGSCGVPSSFVPAVRVDGRVTAACAAANWSDTFFAEAAFFAAFVGAFLVVFFVAFADFCVRVGAGTLSVSAVSTACGSSVAAASGPLPPMRIFAASSPKRGLFVEGPLGINAARPRPSPPLRLSGAMKTLNLSRGLAQWGGYVKEGQRFRHRQHNLQGADQWDRSPQWGQNHHEPQVLSQRLDKP